MLTSLDKENVAGTHFRVTDKQHPLNAKQVTEYSDAFGVVIISIDVFLNKSYIYK